MVRAEGVDDHAQHMGSQQRAGGDHQGKSAAHLHVDVAHAWVLLLPVADVRDPGDIGGLLEAVGGCGERFLQVFEPGVVDQEVEIGEIFGGVGDIHGIPPVGIARKWQALVQADVFDASLACILQRWVGELLIVHPPALLSLGAGYAVVALPSIDLEFFHLGVHVLQVLLAEVRREVAVADDARRARQFVDPAVALVNHFRRKHIGFF